MQLLIDGELCKRTPETTRVLNLTKQSQTFVFKNVSGPVVPSILRGFSAPVKIVTQPSDEELFFRMAHDSDSFNRYEAAERLMLKTLHGLIKDYKDEIPFKLRQDFLDAFAANLASATDGDQAFAARMLSLPIYDIVVQGLKTVDPDAVREAMEFVNETLAETFKDEFARIYKETAAPDGEVYSVAPGQVGRRDLHNASLAFLSGLETPEVLEAAKHQYHQ